MRIPFVIVAVAVAGIALAGCANSSAQRPNRMFGLTSGPLPTPKTFVVDGRPTQPKTYPLVGTTPPARSDRVLSQNERKALEANLLATPGRQPSPDEKKAKNGRPKKPVVPRQKTGFFPPN